jgi:tRNA 2-thiocytidine biosynthesis protein TtcA
VSYRSPLETRLARKVTKAIVDYRLIEDGDRVMVGLSGGKDSWALMQILDVLRKRAPIAFSLVAVNVNSGYAGFRHDLVTAACAERGWECHVEHTTIGAVMDDVLEDGDTPCSLCARLRRGVLYRLAAEVGATKIALGHHLDDVIETALLNLFFQGALKAMPARLVSAKHQQVVIRPLVLVSEADARSYTQENGLPVIGCCCPACGDLSLKRQRMKRLIAELELEHPDIKQSMIAAIGRVVPTHLLDRRLATEAHLEEESAPAVTLPLRTRADLGLPALHAPAARTGISHSGFGGRAAKSDIIAPAEPASSHEVAGPRQDGRTPAERPHRSVME